MQYTSDMSSNVLIVIILGIVGWMFAKKIENIEYMVAQILEKLDPSADDSDDKEN